MKFLLAVCSVLVIAAASLAQCPCGPQCKCDPCVCVAKAGCPCGAACKCDPCECLMMTSDDTAPIPGGINALAAKALSDAIKRSAPVAPPRPVVTESVDYAAKASTKVVKSVRDEAYERYAGLWQQAVASRMPLVVGVGCEPPAGSGYLSCRLDTLEGKGSDYVVAYSQGQLILAKPANGGLNVLGALPAGSSAGTVQAVLNPPAQAIQQYAMGQCANGQCGIQGGGFYSPPPMMFGSGGSCAGGQCGMPMMGGGGMFMGGGCAGGQCGSPMMMGGGFGGFGGFSGGGCAGGACGIRR